MKMTGLSSRMDAISRPFASYGPEGITTLSPGMWQNHASRLWLCCAAMLSPAPAAVRTTIGSFALPPNMYFILAIWFRIWSPHTPMKSMNMISMMGRRPAAAAPTASPAIPASEMGVGITRSGPNFSISPRDAPKIPT